MAFDSIRDLQIIQCVAARGLVFNSKNEILLVSRDGNKWALPGGHVDKLEPALETCKREVFEETGLTVNAEKIIFVEESIDDKIAEFSTISQRFDLFCLCTCNDTVLDESWIDPDSERVKYRKFFTEEDLQNNQHLHMPKPLRHMTFHAIQSLPSMYSWRDGVSEKYQHLLKSE